MSGGAPAESLPPFAFEGEPGHALDDDRASDLVRADAARLGALGRRAGLSRYLAALPDITSRPAVLDTAIVAVLETSVALGVPRDEVIEGMLDEHPELRAPILAADFLDQTLGRGPGGDEPSGDPVRELPCDIGPRLESGRRRYELRTRMAEGVSGVVYRAIDRAVSTPDGVSVVAVKCLRGTGFRLPHVFKLEAQRARRVEHPSVARVLDAGEDERAGEYLVFEYCEGHTLEQWMTRRGSRPSPGEAVALVLSLCEGVAAVHRAGFCHGDLHPGNVIMQRDGAARLIDFGASRSDARVSGPGPVGALGFAAPEAFRPVPPAGAGTRAHAVDTYALAGLLFWMLAGEPPNGASVEDAEATIGGERRPALERLEGCGRDLREVLGRALAFDAARRHPSVEALAEDLRRTERREPLAWSPGPLAHRLRLAVARAPLAYALLAALLAVSAVCAVSLMATLYVSARSAAAEARTANDALRSAASAETARRKLAESEALRLDMARGVASALNTLMTGVDLKNESMRWLAPLVILERFTADENFAQPVLAADSKRSRMEMSAAAVAGCVERGRIDHVRELFIAGALGVWRVEEGDFAGARSVLELVRGAARRMLAADDPASVRSDLYWAIATVLGDRAGLPGLTAAEKEEAVSILERGRATVPDLGPKMREQAVKALAAAGLSTRK